MLRALHDQTYRRLYLAQVVALFGTGLATVALGLTAYDIAGDQAGRVLGTALTIKMVAYVAVAPVANALVAYLPRRHVLVAADVVRFAAALSLPFAHETWQIYALVFAMQTASATFTPTFQSVIPDVLPDEEDYTAALSLSRLAYDLESVLSPALTALALLAVSSSTVFFGTALGFAASAMLVLSVVVPRRIPTRAPASSFATRLRRGTVLFVRRPALRPILALNLVVACAGAFVVVQTVVVVRSTLHLPEHAVPWILGALGAGSMAAAFALPTTLRTIPERTVMLGGAVAVTGATALIPAVLSLATTTPAVAGVVCLWVIVGLGWAAVETPVGRIIRRTVSGDDLPAAFAAQFSLQHACWLITYPVAGWLGAAGLGTTASVLAGAASAATATAMALWPRDRRLRDASRAEQKVTA